MILLAGAFELVPLLLVLVVATAFALPAGLVVGATGTVLHGMIATGVALALGAGALGFVAERGVRRRQASHEPAWVSTLEALGASERARDEAVGGKARWLGFLVSTGAPVPAGVVLTSALVERILAATASGTAVDRIWPILPVPARRALEAFLAGAKGKLVVRASFTSQDLGHAYPGVFPAVRDVDPRDRERLIAAIISLVGGADDTIGREYRRRRGAPAISSRAVVLQLQVDADISGAVASRGHGGRADCVAVDYAPRRSPVRSVSYDLVDGKAVPLLGEDPVATPAWMHRLAALAVTLEAKLGGPVHLGFAIEGGQPYVIGIRRVAAPERKTWVHAKPLDLSEDRHPTFAQELRGGLPLVRRVLGETLERAGATAGVREDEVRYADGLVYFDAEVLRRALAQLGADVLLRGGLRATLRSIAPVRRRPIPAVPTVTEITPEAWGALHAWQTRHLLGAAHVRHDLVAREWLIRALLRLIDGTGSEVEDPRGHPALRWLLKRRLREAAEESERQRVVLEQAEAELGSAVARLLARGAAGWNAMFKGDRHLHATLEEIDRWHEDIGAREALEVEWRDRRSAFDQRKDQPLVLRVHRPALPVPPTDAVLGTSLVPTGRTTAAAAPKLRGLALVPGMARGPAVVMTQHAGTIAHGAVILVSDPQPDLCLHVFDARGVVLLSGGVLSHAVRLAEELGVPTVLCPGARSFNTHDVVVDGQAGTLTVIR